ncbi:MAG: DUF5696 domain-containing protein [Clostridia bacterium]|nr:DUF5696 domain-containing protein [Clostridia bacterium]
MKKQIAAALVAASMCISFMPVSAQPFEMQPSASQTEASPKERVFPIPESFEKVAENDSYILYAQTSSGEIAVTVKKNGYNWFSNPQDRSEDTIAGGEVKKKLEAQLVLYYTQGYSSMVTNSVTGCVNRKGLKSQKIDKGIKFSYEFKDAGFTIPVQYTLDDDGLKAEVLLQEITPKVVTRQESVNGSKNKVDVDYNITKIDFLPFFGAAGSKESGYMFVPEGAGALIYLNNGKTNYVSYSAPVYGQYRDIPTMRDLSNDLVRLPVFGLKRGNNAFLAIIEKNEAIGYINAAVSGRETSFNTVYPSVQDKIIDFSVGSNRTQPLSESLAAEGSFQIKYHFFTGDKANYSQMAKCYQDYLISEKGLEKTESSDKNEFYLETYSGVERKTSVFGIVRRVLDPLTTYADLEEIAKKYMDAGIGNLVIKYNGWTKNSERNEIKTQASYESKLGGKSGFYKLSEFMKNNNISFYPAMNFVEYSKSRIGYSAIFDAAKAPNQSPAYQKTSSGSEGMFGKRWSYLKPNKVEDAGMAFLANYKKLAIGAIALDNIGEIVYSDNTKGGVKRGQTVNIWENVLKEYKTSTGAVMVDNANAYAIPYAENIIDVPLNEYGTELADENIPFYQMVIHGLVSYSTPAINLTSDWDRTVLKAVETGACLNFTLVRGNTQVLKDSYLNNLYSCDFDTWFERTVEDYKRVSKAADETKGKKMTGHSKIAEGVYETVYEGNIRTIVNYNHEEVNTSYGTVGAMDFILVK